MSARDEKKGASVNSSEPRARRAHGTVRKITGGLFLYTGGIHLGIVAARPQLYGPFANEAVIPHITEAWKQVFMAQPSAWGLVLSLGEAALGVLLLRGGNGARAGWLGVIAFHVGLIFFGWGFWLWSIPFLAIVIPAARQDLHIGPGHQRAGSPAPAQ